MRTVLRHVRELHSLGPANNDHLSALRAAVSVAVPSLLLLVIGRPDLTMCAGWIRGHTWNPRTCPAASTAASTASSEHCSGR